MLEAKDFHSFGDAIIKKMIAEIADARGGIVASKPLAATCTRTASLIEFTAIRKSWC